MAATSYRCQCGATLRYKQDLVAESGGVRATWLCKDCRTPVPRQTAEKLRHQHPS
jgi:predicted SprT family Zn-dependent metalloprotease